MKWHRIDINLFFDHYGVGHRSCNGRSSTWVRWEIMVRGYFAACSCSWIGRELVVTASQGDGHQRQKSEFNTRSRRKHWKYLQVRIALGLLKWIAIEHCLYCVPYRFPTLADTICSWEIHSNKYKVRQKQHHNRWSKHRSVPVIHDKVVPHQPLHTTINKPHRLHRHMQPKQTFQRTKINRNSIANFVCFFFVFRSTSAPNFQ